MNKITVISTPHRPHSQFILTEDKNYRLDVFTDGYLVTEGWYVPLGEGEYVWETQNKLVLDENRKIRRTHKTMKKILKEVLSKFADMGVM